MMLFRHAFNVVDIGEVVHSFLGFDHRPLDGNFQRIQTDFVCGWVEIVVSIFRLLVSSVD